MNSFDVEIAYKKSETEFDTLYPQTTDDNVFLSFDVLNEFEGSTLADALIELKQSVPSAEKVAQAVPIITIDNNGLITASAAQQAGYVDSGTKSSTKQLPTKGATTYTPGVSNQTISNAGTFLTGIQTIKGDENLVPANIKKGISIFGVNGEYSGTETSIKGWNCKIINNSSRSLFVLTTLSELVNEDMFVIIDENTLIGSYVYTLNANNNITFKAYGNEIRVFSATTLGNSYKITGTASPTGSVTSYTGAEAILSVDYYSVDHTPSGLTTFTLNVVSS